VQSFSTVEPAIDLGASTLTFARQVAGLHRLILITDQLAWQLRRSQQQP